MKYIDLKMIIKKPYFKEQDIILKNLKIFNYQLALWQKKGYIERLKRGFYIFTEEKEKMTQQEIAFLLYDPSYISLESALSHYGFIPEMVYSVTSVTPRTTRQFSNSFGNFSYRHIKPNLFFGYIPFKTENGVYFMAEPEKAIIDFFYLNLDRIKNQSYVDELRLNSEELKRIINKSKLTGYLKEYKIIKLEKIILNLIDKC